MAFLGKKGSDDNMQETANGSEMASIQRGPIKVKMNPRPVEINLLTYKKEGKESNIAVLLLVLAGVAMAGVMLFFYMDGSNQLAEMKQQNDTLNQTYNDLVKTTGTAAGLEQMQTAVANKKLNVTTAESQRVKYSKFISEIATVIPTGVYLTGMNVGTGTLSVSGFATQYSGVATFEAGLREKPLFKSVTVTNCSKGAANSEQVLFTMELGWEVSKL